MYPDVTVRSLTSETIRYAGVTLNGYAEIEIPLSKYGDAIAQATMFSLERAALANPPRVEFVSGWTPIGAPIIGAAISEAEAAKYQQRRAKKPAYIVEGKAVAPEVELPTGNPKTQHPEAFKPTPISPTIDRHGPTGIREVRETETAVDVPLDNAGL